MKCGQCKQTCYCSKEHQIIHWKTGKHKEHCNNNNSYNNNSNNHNNIKNNDNDNNSTETIIKKLELCRKEILFPEYEIISEKERDSSGDEETIDKSDSLGTTYYI